MIGHSMLQGGPPFPFFAPWCYAILTEKSEDEVMSIVSTCDYVSLIPLNAGTAVVITFLKMLSEAKSDKEINDIFDVQTDGPAYEQVVNSSQWPIETRITMANLETLKSMIVWEELVLKREKQLSALREGLAYIGVLPLMITYPLLLSEYFIATSEKLTSERMFDIVSWDDIDSSTNSDAVSYFRQFISESSSERLTKLLTFVTGFSVLSSLNSPAIDLKYAGADKALPEAEACFSILKIPIKHRSYSEFEKFMDIALDHGCEGYGNM